MFANRKHIIKSYEKIEEDFTLHTSEGEYQGVRGEYLGINLDGDRVLISEEYMKNMANIEVKSHPRIKKESPFVSVYMRQLSEMSKLDQSEDANYIKGKQNGWILDNK